MRYIIDASVNHKTVSGDNNQNHFFSDRPMLGYVWYSFYGVLETRSDQLDMEGDNNMAVRVI